MVLVISSSGPIAQSGSPSGIEKYQELRVTINNARSGFGSAATFNLPGGLSVKDITLTETANGVSLVVRMRGMVNGPVEIRSGNNQVGILLTKDAQPEVLWSMAKAQPAQDWQVAAPPAQGSKQSAAVYMVGEEPPELNGAHKVIGAELAKALTASTAYIAVDRTQEGLNILAKEHIYQRGGAVDNEQIQELGKQLGVRYVCRAEISEVMKGYFLEARIVNVETAEMSSVATKYLNMASAEDVMRTAQEVSMELLSGKRKIANYTFLEIAVNPDKAIADYTEAIRQKPDVVEYYFKRGFAYDYKRDYDNAIADFNEVIRLNPNDAVAYKNRGSAYLSKGNPDQAIVNHNKAIRLNPKFAYAYNGRGMAYHMKKDYNKAIADYNKAIRWNPDYAVAYINRGNAYLGKGDFKRAIDDFNRVIRQYPNCAGAYYVRGKLYKIKRDYDQAIADYSEAIRLNPKFADAYNERGEAYSNKGDYDRAIADYSEAIRLDTNIVAPYINR
jgi:tetratricopeptide (TPR) repeat protein